jgi:cell division septal protein FtsQ
MFRRSVRSHRPEKKRTSRFSRRFFGKLGVFILIVLLFGSGWWFFTSVKTDFELKLDEITCADELKVTQSLEKQQIKFYWLQSQEVERKLRQDFACINEAKIERKFPKAVLVELSGRKPVAVFRVTQKLTPSPLPIEAMEATPSTIEAKPSPSPSPSPQVIVTFGETFLIDNKGVGYSKGFREDLPLVNYVATRFDIGDSIGAESISRLLQIVDFFQKQGQTPSMIEIDHEKLTVKTTEEIVFSLSDGLERQGASLQLIWKQAKMNSKSVVKIDLRFDKPVVTYVPEKK